MIIADGITPDFGFQCGPTFHTTIAALQSGREKRNADWSQAKHEASADYGLLSPPQFIYLKDLFQQCRGQVFPFLFRDWTDYSAVDAPFGVGDGTTTTFQLSKTSALVGGSPYVRTVRAPEPGVVVSVDGVVTGATVSQLDGSVTFAVAPANGAQITWTGKFWLVMRFNSDSLKATVLQAFYDDGTPMLSGSVDLIEVFDDAA